MIPIKNTTSGANFIKIGEGRFWAKFRCHVLPHMVKPHFFALFGLKLVLYTGYVNLPESFLVLFCTLDLNMTLSFLQ
ncbi:hypothetical protein B9Z55_005572 [Caenorhabditis nigoni]|uniref:Uncharacterized protein n=1 Tax=Caenorhabditis nigoni TaxID=1611254 RepID=A0A2G5V1E5_9PELO|nr:hypothetical protein B9Z55_005572 [Caenorhabditis nigoni]